jgi:hypothetical protein
VMNKMTSTFFKWRFLTTLDATWLHLLTLLILADVRLAAILSLHFLFQDVCNQMQQRQAAVARHSPQ